MGKLLATTVASAVGLAAALGAAAQITPTSPSKAPAQYDMGKKPPRIRPAVDGLVGTDKNLEAFLQSAKRNLGTIQPKLAIPKDVVMQSISTPIEDMSSLALHFEEQRIKPVWDVGVEQESAQVTPLIQLRSIISAPQTDSLRLMAADFARLEKTNRFQPQVLCKEALPFCGRTLLTEGWQVNKAGRRELVAELGNIKGPRPPGRAILVQGRDKILGTIDVQGQVFQLRQLTGEKFAVYTRKDQDKDRNPDDVAQRREGAPITSPPSPRPKPIPEAAKQCANPTGSPSIDVVVGISPAARTAAWKEQESISDLLVIAETMGNKSLKDSRINGAIRIVADEAQPFAESRDFRKDVAALVAGQPPLNQMHELRRKHAADVGILVVEDPNSTYCGMAPVYRANKSNAFAIVNWRCLSGTKYGLVHEIGHLIGTYHDPATEGAMVQATPPYAYGFAQKPPEPMVTIMGYLKACGGQCSRPALWANPELKDRLGRPIGTPGQSFDACVWRERLPEVSTFDGG